MNIIVMLSEAKYLIVKYHECAEMLHFVQHDMGLASEATPYCMHCTSSSPIIAGATTTPLQR